MNERTLATGWVRMRQADGTIRQEYDPESAALLLRLRELDRQVLADCTEHLR